MDRLLMTCFAKAFWCQISTGRFRTLLANHLGHVNVFLHYYSFHRHQKVVLLGLTQRMSISKRKKKLTAAGIIKLYTLAVIYPIGLLYSSKISVSLNEHLTGFRTTNLETICAKSPTQLFRNILCTVHFSVLLAS